MTTDQSPAFLRYDLGELAALPDGTILLCRIGDTDNDPDVYRRHGREWWRLSASGEHEWSTTEELDSPFATFHIAWNPDLTQEV